MKRSVLLLFTTLFLSFFVLSTSVIASTVGWIDTERFAYEGTITRYDDEDLTSQVDQISIGDIQGYDRDLTLWSDSSYPATAVMSSWWYSTAVDENGDALGRGYGNVNGNTGPGFMQYYDLSQDFVKDQYYGFSDYDGSYWTTFSFGLDVENAAAYSRLSAPGNTGDSGIFKSLNVNLTATGLQGQLQTNGMIVAQESDAFPSGVSGTMTGIFENTSSITANNGYYAFDFNINMNNWAYANRDSLVGDFDTFYQGSYAAPVPEPSTILLMSVGLLGVLGVCRRKRS